MGREMRIKQILEEHCTPELLEIIDESHKHRNAPGEASHIKLLVVSDKFQDISKINRHRLLNTLLKNEFQNGLHALTMDLFTREEWEAKGGERQPSPPCRGGQQT